MSKLTIKMKPGFEAELQRQVQNSPAFKKLAEDFNVKLNGVRKRMAGRESAAIRGELVKELPVLATAENASLLASMVAEIAGLARA